MQTNAPKLVRPPRLYLDTAHLVNIARLRGGEKLQSEAHRADYELLDDYIRRRHFGLVYNPAAPLDWVDGNATTVSVKQIAAVFDSAKLVYYSAGDPFTYTIEVLDECRRLEPSLSVPELPVMQQLLAGNDIVVPLGVLARLAPRFLNPDEVPDEGVEHFPDRIRLPSMTAVALATLRFKDRKPDVYQERVYGFKAALANDVSHREEIRRKRSEADAEWMQHFLRMDRILEAVAPGIDAMAILRRVDVDRCPAVKLWSAARWKRVMAGFPAKDNDADDWASLPLVPYVDLLLTERHLREFIVQADRGLAAKVKASVAEAVEVLRQWT